MWQCKHCLPVNLYHSEPELHHRANDCDFVQHWHGFCIVNMTFQRSKITLQQFKGMTSVPCLSIQSRFLSSWKLGQQKAQLIFQDSSIAVDIIHWITVWIKHQVPLIALTPAFPFCWALILKPLSRTPWFIMHIVSF